MPGKTLQDAIMEELNNPAHEGLLDAAERLNEIADNQRAQEEHNHKEES